MGLTMRCGWAYQHVSIDSTGVFRPCCGWRIVGNEQQVDSVDQYLVGDFRRDLLDTLHNDVWPTGCEDCKLDEELDNKSLRTGAEKRYSNPLYTDAEVKFGNLCNLACAMCSPYNSSLIEKEYLKLKGQHKLFDRGFENKNAWYEDSDKLKQIARELSTRNQIRFTGGEPTVNNYLIDFLEEVQKHNTNITIKLTTNGNNWPKKLHELLKEFKTIISVSIDAYGEKNNYIRWPSNWNKIEKNVDSMLSLPNSTVECGSTIASYNVHLIEELAQWVLKKGLTHNIDPVWTPEIFKPCNTTQEIKTQFEQFASTYKPAQRVLKNVLAQGNGLQQTIDFLSILDYNRNVNYRVLEL